MANKITVFQCDTCARQIELELDDARPYPSRCNITNKCPGFLTAIKRQSARTELFPPIVYGLQDYIPRGTPATAPVDDDPNPNVSLLSGLGRLTLAALELNGNFFSEDVLADDGVTVIPSQNLFNNPLNIDDPTGGKFNYANSEAIKVSLELFELGVDNTTFTEYYYSLSGLTQEISGVDSSPSRLLLRFTVDDTIRVLVNGQELVRGTDFEAEVRPTGESVVVFTPLLTASLNIVRVLVYKEPASIDDPNSPNIRVLEFIGRADGNSDRKHECWGDTLEASINNINKLVLTCVNPSALELDNLYRVRAAYVISPVNLNRKYFLSLEKLFLLFGDAPYAFVDKSRDIVLNLKTAADNGVQLEYIQDELGNATLFAPKNSLTNLTISVNATLSADTTLLDDADEAVHFENTNISSKYIIGHV